MGIAEDYLELPALETKRLELIQRLQEGEDTEQIQADLQELEQVESQIKDIKDRIDIILNCQY